MKTRIIVSLDNDLVELIRQEALHTHRRFGEVMEERLKRGYADTESGKREKPFVAEPYDTGGFAPGVDQNKLNQLFETLENEADCK